MAEDTKLHQVDIFGQSYNLRGEGDNTYINELAAYVDKIMREISESTGTVDTVKVAILASLNIADDYLSLKKASSGGDDDDKIISSLVKKIDICLAEEEGR